ncbi:PREDICTED: uveal autoantigen with coiled-coil domains and ankyrin repeats protein-like [Ceratosolen solmsi marchali]|uniref:Uveal autoantigen with coiled-coil domains and ankyrin repeats protein-like n=1 Tax=Ceratosolen solmsi marchali TaxID=326594 RepID=A0AAJ6VJC7_9HYME|nr:PREDICTED: uveal autoantigen with coiled-coil domains and ankyrin repeats protein-like [Ceratosolen solmsi marchali]
MGEFYIYIIENFFTIIIRDSFLLQQELEEQKQKMFHMKLKIKELLDLKNIYEQDSSNVQCKYQKVIGEMKQLKISFQDSQRKLLSEKQTEIEKLLNENNDFKKQFQVYKLDLNLIQEEMRKMGITKPSFGCFKAKIEIMRSENKRLRCDIEYYQQMISNLKFDNECLKMKLQDLSCINGENYKEANNFLQSEIIQKPEKMNGITNDSATTKLKEENQILKLSNTKYQLLEIQQNYERVLQELNRCSMDFIKVSETCNCNQTDEKKEYKKFEEIEKKLMKDLEDAKEKLEKYEIYERTCQRQKDEIMLLKKKLVSTNQQLMNCNITKEEMLRQNKLFEENNNKSMAELEDIVVQLEDMQNSLTTLKTQCDMKTQSLENISVELANMKRSRTEGCEESKHVLSCVRIWIRQQKHRINVLQEKLCEKQQQLMCISSEKKKLLITIKRLIRENKILTKGLKFIRRQMANKQTDGAECLPKRQIHSSHFKQKYGLRNGFQSIHLNNKQSNAIYSHFKRECREKSNLSKDKIRIQGDHKLFSALEYLTENIPRTSQIKENFSD